MTPVCIITRQPAHGCWCVTRYWPVMGRRRTYVYYPATVLAVIENWRGTVKIRSQR